MSPSVATSPPNVRVRLLAEPDLESASRIFRLAFGTFIGLPDPLTFMGDAELVSSRWRTDPTSAFGAFVGDELVGSNIATNWGSVGFFGPLTVRPDLWDAGIGKRLTEPVIDRFAAWGTRHAGLFTFPHSQKHLGLYHRYGFRPRFLTAVMAKPIAPSSPERPRWTRLSEAAGAEREDLLASCRQLTDSVYGGLDVTSEIRAVVDERLGDAILLWRDSRLVGLAICHSGSGSEAGSGLCYVKFGAVRSSGTAAQDFDDLLSVCEAEATVRGASRLIAGVSTAREEAYTQMRARGFRIDMLGVAMHRPNEAGYSRTGMYVIDDWR